MKDISTPIVAASRCRLRSAAATALAVSSVVQLTFCTSGIQIAPFSVPQSSLPAPM